MTFDEEREYTALSNLFTSEKKSLLFGEIIELFTQNIWEPEFSLNMFIALRDKGYLKITDEHLTIHPDGTRTDSPANVKYVLSKLGIEVYLYRAKEKARDEIDGQLKSITLSNIKFNKYLPLTAAIISAIAIIVSAWINGCNKEKVVTYKLEESQAKELIEELRKNKHTLPPVQDSFPLDSSTSATSQSDTASAKKSY